MGEVGAKHRLPGIRTVIEPEQVASVRMPCGQCRVNRSTELARTRGLNEERQHFVGRSRHAPYLPEPVPDRTRLEVVQLREAELHALRSLIAPRLLTWTHPLEPVEHRCHHF